ncbi:uncharacterized protein LOC133171548 [Saccostrea echinata]|uniref:uncharacterized protein LOC133171548 n=1 Tax=Saccostrea echinata TaxID=191078 RepID=UPI002A81DCE8|nr:uncharacterized protein LOC133171548 [Saccostrea echinata]
MENKESQRLLSPRGSDTRIYSIDNIDNIEIKPSRVAEIAKRLKSGKENLNSTVFNDPSRNPSNSEKASMRTTPYSRPSSQISGNRGLVSGKENIKESYGKDDEKKSSSIVRKTGDLFRMETAIPSPNPRISSSCLSQSSVRSTRNGSAKSNRNVYCSNKKDMLDQTSPRNNGECYYRSESNLSGFDKQYKSKTPDSKSQSDRRTPVKECLSQSRTSDCVSQAGHKSSVRGPLSRSRNSDQGAERNDQIGKHTGNVETSPREIERPSCSPKKIEYHYDDDFEEDEGLEKEINKKKTVSSTESEDDFWNTDDDDDEKPNEKASLKPNLVPLASVDSTQKLDQIGHEPLEPNFVNLKQSDVEKVFASKVGLDSHFESRNGSRNSLSCNKAAGNNSRADSKISSRESHSESRSLYNDSRAGGRTHDRESYTESRLSAYSSHSVCMTPSNDANADCTSLDREASNCRTPGTDSRSGSRASNCEFRTVSRTQERESNSSCRKLDDNSPADHRTLASASLSGWKTLDNDSHPGSRVPHNDSRADRRTPLRESLSGSRSPDNSSRSGSRTRKNNYSPEKSNQSFEKLSGHTGNEETSPREMDRPSCSPKVVEYHYDDDFEDYKSLEKEKNSKETMVSAESEDDFWNTGDDDLIKSKKLKEAVSLDPKLAAFAPVKQLQKLDQTGHEFLEADCVKLRPSIMENWNSVSTHKENANKSPTSAEQTTAEACAQWVAETNSHTVPKDPQDLSALIAEKILGDKNEFKITGKKIRKSRKTAQNEMGKTKREPSKPPDPVNEKQKERKKAKRAKARLQDFTALEHRCMNGEKNNMEGMIITGTAKSSPYLNRQDQRMGNMKGTCSTAIDLPAISNTLDDLKVSPYLKQGQRRQPAGIALPRINATRINPQSHEHHGDRKKSSNAISRQHKMIQPEEEIGNNQWKPEVRKLPQRPRQINERTLRKLSCPPTHPKAEVTLNGDGLEVTIMDPCSREYDSDKKNIKITVLHHSNKIYKEFPTHPSRHELYHEYSSDPDIIKHRAQGPPFVTEMKRNYSKH